ncbi:hypothetical protein AcV5_000729 [Taiwanofungus camphoratus]|nr:hypothetical protein AcV5_000729 [Antrodia cinnamomea]
MTSELSNALNPHIVAARRQRPVYIPNVVENNTTPVIEQPQPYVPHRSELELAIAEPPPPPPPPQACTQSPRQSLNHVNAVRELLRILSTTKEAAEIERRRRLAWEKEQEAKYAQRQAEMERQMLDMRQEISLLKAYISLNPHPNSANPVLPASAISSIAHIEASPGAVQESDSAHQLHAPNESTAQFPMSPLTPVSESPQYQAPTFVEGSSSPFVPNTGAFTPNTTENETNHQSNTPLANPLGSVTPSSTSQLNEPTPQPSTSSPNLRKRPTPAVQSDEDEEGSSGDESSDFPAPDRPLRRANGHDARCLTIQAC